MIIIYIYKIYIKMIIIYIYKIYIKMIIQLNKFNGLYLINSLGHFYNKRIFSILFLPFL